MIVTNKQPSKIRYVFSLIVIGKKSVIRLRLVRNLIRERRARRKIINNLVDNAMTRDGPGA